METKQSLLLGMDSPTHQFLGSIEPSYQFNLVGKKGAYPMPLTFLELEKLRSDSQKFAKSFSIVPGASFIAVESMITKLLGSYEKSYRQIYEIGGDDYTFMQIQEKYNFSINSLDTFTMDGQPNAMGMNFRFDETRDYNEEEIRPAFTNEVSSEKLNDLYKTLIEGISAPNKSNAVSLSTNSSVYKRVKTQNSNYDESKWGNWTTKHYVANDYYSKIRRMNGKYPNLYHPSTIKEYMEFFNKNKQDGWLHPDKSAYYICLVLSQIQDYFNEIYGSKNKMIIFSAIRYENRPNMYRVKRNRLRPDGSVTYKIIKKPFSEIDNSFIDNSQVRKEVAIKKYRSMHYAGGAVDIYYPGQNATEVLIYIYLMMLFNFIEDPVPSAKRTGRFLGLGVYGLDSHVRDNLMNSGIGRNGFVHIDLNYMVEEESIDNKHSIYKEKSFNRNLRNWYGETGNDKYLSSEQNGLPIWTILKRYKDNKNIKINDNDNNLLLAKNFEKLETYIDRLLKAHKTLKEGETSDNLKAKFESLAKRL
jgi:hypothetical protein